MEAWWHGLSLEQQIFWSVALLSSLVLLLQLLGMMLGFEHGADIGHADPSVSGDMSGVHVLSVRAIVAFAVGFGWTGVIALEHGAGVPIAIVLAVAVGAFFMYVVYRLMLSVAKLRASGTLDYRNAVGEIGTAYVPIPAALAGGGQVEILVQGRLVFVNAATKGAAIPGRARVKVVDLVDRTTLLVEPVA
jgi:hypothetical protein